MLLKSPQDGAGSKYEDAAVPQILTRLRVNARSLESRFLDEGKDLAPEARQRISSLNVAEPSLRTTRQDPEGDQITLVCQRSGLANAVSELLRLGDVMIRGQHRENSLWIFLEDPHRSQTDCGPVFLAIGSIKMLPVGSCL